MAGWGIGWGDWGVVGEMVTFGGGIWQIWDIRIFGSSKEKSNSQKQII